MNTRSDWLCERDVAQRSGLPGPLVADLLPRLPTPIDVDYTDTAQVYDEDSAYRARLAVHMLHNGIRLRFIRLAVREPMTLAELKRACQQWATMPTKAHQPVQPLGALPRWAPWHVTVLVVAVLLCAAAAITIGSILPLKP
ncbi:hypothetical protein [Mycolicibacterium sp. 120270]|uniref:hypothetical protein n=1 Tax=Mycolicibacterium sp. 120270 TaxID=3090600 RepID=UPI00299EA3F1|nr:hypothetical protein [Mycolicibacterium sp. 120270]MDX1886837.1 hypothetical protein [Mycolicibacterium sp. 120270]